MRRISAWVTAALLVASGVSACGGSAGVDVSSKSPGQLVRSALAAAYHAPAVHVTISSSSTRLTFDLAAGRGGKGVMTLRGKPLKVIVVGGQVYVNGGIEYLAGRAGSSVASRLAGKWLKLPPTSVLARQVAAFADIHSLLGVAPPAASTLTIAGRGSVNGAPVIGVRSRDTGRTLWIGTAHGYPLELRDPTTRVRFSRYGEPVSLSAPAGAVDLSK